VTAYVVPSANGVYAVLGGVSVYDPTMGGYTYLAWSAAGGCFHEAVDLNSVSGGDADLGQPVVTPLDGTVVYVGHGDGWGQDFGNHVAVSIDDPRAIAPCYFHPCHLDRITCEVGQRLPAGTPVGACGKTDNQPHAHVHAAFWREPPPGNNWNFWQMGYSQQWVADHTYDPRWWFTESSAKAGRMLEESEEAIPMDTTPEERAAMKPYFESLGHGLDVETAIGKLVCLSYKRNETPGPCLGPEYPAVAPDGSQVVRQHFTGRIGEAKPLPDGTWWTGYVEVVLHPEVLG
jgi:Peptidase family M23